MSAKFTFDEIVASMTSQGIPREKAEWQARHECGIPHPVASAVLHVVGEPLAFPIRLTLPWSALCSDNEREKASLYMQGGKPVPRKVMTARYKAAREKIVSVARRAMIAGETTFPPLDEPLSLMALVYAPTQRRVDVANFAKGVHDALNKIVYTDDQWLYDVRWVRAGDDMDAPRAEIAIAPLVSR